MHEDAPTMNDARPQGITVRIEERAADARIAHLSIDNVRRLNSLNSALMTEFVDTVVYYAFNRTNVELKFLRNLLSKFGYRYAYE